MSQLHHEHKALSQYPYRLWAKGPCFYCGRETFRSDQQHVPWGFTIDHLVPRAILHGKVRDTFQRPTVVACRECNHKKGVLSVEEFMCIYHPERVLNLDWPFIRKIEARCLKEMSLASL